MHNFFDCNMKISNRIIIGLMVFFMGFNANATKLTVTIEGPGSVDGLRDTSFVVDFNPEEEPLIEFLAKCDPMTELEATSEVITIELHPLWEYEDPYNIPQGDGSKEYSCYADVDDIWYDCSINFKFRKIDLSEYVPIINECGLCCDISYYGELLVNGCFVNYLNVWNGYFDPGPNYENIYVKKGSILKIEGGADAESVWNIIEDPGSIFECEGEMVVNGEHYEDYNFRCVIKADGPIQCCVEVIKNRIFHYDFYLDSEGPGVTRLYYWDSLVPDYPGYGSYSFGYEADEGMIGPSVFAIPNEGNKIIKFLVDGSDLLRNELLNNSNYTSGDSINVYPRESCFIKYGPMNTPFIVAEDKETFYGDSPGDFSWRVLEGNIIGEPYLTTNASCTSLPGVYSITVAKGTIANDCALLNGSLTIRKAPLKCRAQDITIQQGEKIPSIPILYEGFKNDEDARYLWSEPQASTITSSLVPGEYEIKVSGGYSYNYEFEYLSGKLTIVPRPDAIVFADEKIKNICMSKWDANHDGMLIYDEAAAVQSIGSVFQGNQEITSFNELRFFTGLKDIPANAFQNCTSLQSLTIPSNVESIGLSAFLNCKALQSLNIPSGVKSIGQNALSGCTKMTRIDVDEENEWFKSIDGVLFTKDASTLVQFPAAKCSEYIVPEGTKVIGPDAFYQSELVSIALPSTIGQLGYDAFGYCKNLISIDLPAGLLSISEYAFDHCTALTSVNINRGIESIGSHAFNYCISLTNIVLPEGIAIIGDQAFDHCVYLESVTIPSTVVEFGQNIFNYCKKLTDVYAYMPSPFDINENNFPEEVYNNAVLHVPSGSESAYANAGGWKRFTSINGDLTFIDPNLTFSASDIFVRPGNTCELVVGLQNGEMVINAYQFNLELPEGFTLAENDGEYLYALSDRYSKKRNMQVTISREGSNIYSVVCFSLSSEVITGSEGPVITFTLSASDNIEDDNTGRLTDIVVSTTDGQGLPLADIEFNISKLKYALGDTNGDGSVNVADVMLIVNHILGNTLPVFHEECANMNGDSRIDVADVMLVVNMILSGEAQAPASAQFETSGLEAVSRSVNKVELRMDNMSEYTAFQMQVQTPTDVRLIGVELAEDATGHRVLTKEIGDGLYNVVVYSLIGENFKDASDGTLLRLMTSGSAKGLEIKNIQFTNQSFETITFSDVTGTTGIEDVSSDATDGVYYNLQGMPVKNPNHGVYIKDGKKMTR